MATCTAGEGHAVAFSNHSELGIRRLSAGTGRGRRERWRSRSHNSGMLSSKGQDSACLGRIVAVDAVREFTDGTDDECSCVDLVIACYFSCLLSCFCSCVLVPRRRCCNSGTRCNDRRFTNREERRYHGGAIERVNVAADDILMDAKDICVMLYGVVFVCGEGSAKAEPWRISPAPLRSALKEPTMNRCRITSYDGRDRLLCWS